MKAVNFNPTEMEWWAMLEAENFLASGEANNETDEALAYLLKNDIYVSINAGEFCKGDNSPT